MDDGMGYTAHAGLGGLEYGWTCDNDPEIGGSLIDWSGGIRGLGRGDGLGINHFDRNSQCGGAAEWQLDVPNGDYQVYVDFGKKIRFSIFAFRFR